MKDKDKTIGAYKHAIAVCKKVFEQKMHDYGTAWLVLRLPSITDLVLIKARRVRTIQETGQQKVQDNIKDEFVGMINYCIMAVIQIHAKDSTEIGDTFNQIEMTYNNVVDDALFLLQNKNHDYGEAWRAMRVSSITDIILMKLLRVKQIENNAGTTLVSEGVRANYLDILNYSVFALIKLEKV